ncbi:Cyclin-dependent kinase F-4 [Dendrobium catenatum]|uniref:Cyclin-dependent kinase F-4 n=1 Tax=Dendrobium catenatum TaxID=906689 RepID=A0A2I0VK91_9ASPA|nr:Cyclin-dependent kinase F-4 [Dendrobium catenatum]
METEIRNWCYQIFQGLSYMHHRGYFHRDLKPDWLPTCKCYQLEIVFEADEIHKICSVIGSPDHGTWAEGLQLADAMSYKFPQVPCANLAELIPSASENAVNLIKSLCAWDPTKRPKAAEVLQHPFFQASYYVPPSLRPRVPNTPPSVGSKGSLEQKSGRRYSTGALSSNKPASNVLRAKINCSLKSGGVQRKLSMDQQEAEKSGKLKNSLKHPRYQPPARQNQGLLRSVGENIIISKKSMQRIPDEARSVLPRNFTNTMRRSSSKASASDDEVAEKLAKLSVGSGTGSASGGARPPPPPPSLKAGGWHSHTDFLTRSYEVPSARRYSRKVVG